MIRELESDLFDLEVDAFAHGCNLSGIMNAGIAREFKARYPDMFMEYNAYCRAGTFSLGDVHFYRPQDGRPNVINVGIQETTESRAIIEYVERGLEKIQESYGVWKINSIAMPRIGCGLGGLDWKDVRKVVERVFGSSDLSVVVASK